MKHVLDDPRSANEICTVLQKKIGSWYSVGFPRFFPSPFRGNDVAHLHQGSSELSNFDNGPRYTACSGGSWSVGDGLDKLILNNVVIHGEAPRSSSTFTQ